MKSLVSVEGASNIELFYDLIFVYCISAITALRRHMHGDFLDVGMWGVFMFPYLVVLQVWFFTTLLMNRYRDRSASDNACPLANMALYFPGERHRRRLEELGVRVQRGTGSHTDH